MDPRTGNSTFKIQTSKKFQTPSIISGKSARGLAHSRTHPRPPVNPGWREASWSAAALRRFLRAVVWPLATLCSCASAEDAAPTELEIFFGGAGFTNIPPLTGLDVGAGSQPAIRPSHQPRIGMPINNRRISRLAIRATTAGFGGWSVRTGMFEYVPKGDVLSPDWWQIYAVTLACLHNRSWLRFSKKTAMTTSTMAMETQTAAKPGWGVFAYKIAAPPLQAAATRNPLIPLMWTRSRSVRWSFGIAR